MVYAASCSGFFSRHTFADIMASYRSHKIINDRAWVHSDCPSLLVVAPSTREWSIMFGPARNQDCVAAETGTELTSFIPLHCWKNLLGWAQEWQDPQQGQENVLNRVLQCEHMAPSLFAMWHDGLADTSPNLLNITGPSQCPRVDKPHPASIAATRPAVAGCVRKDVEQVIWNGPGVADGYSWQLS